MPIDALPQLIPFPFMTLVAAERDDLSPRDLLEVIEDLFDNTNGLAGVFIDAGIAIELQIGPQSRMAAIYVAEYVKQKGISPAACDIAASASARISSVAASNAASHG